MLFVIAKKYKLNVAGLHFDNKYDLPVAYLMIENGNPTLNAMLNHEISDLLSEKESLYPKIFAAGVQSVKGESCL